MRPYFTGFKNIFSHTTFLSMKNLIFIFSLALSTTALNAQKPLQFAFTAGGVRATPKLQESQTMADLQAFRQDTSFAQFAQAADYQTSVSSPQFSLGLRIQPLRKVPVYAFGDIYTSPFLMAEISFKYGAGIYFRQYIKPTIRKKRKYGFYTDFGIEYAVMYDKGFNHDGNVKSIGNEEVKQQMKDLLGMQPKPAFKSDVVSSYLSFGHISLRETEIGLQLKYYYDYNAGKSGSLNQFQFSLYTRF